MKRSFFELSAEDYKKPRARVPQCGLCALHENCLTPKMPVWGQGKRGVLIVSDHPRKDGDTYNAPFDRNTMQELENITHHAGFDLEEDCWSTTALRCRTARDAQATKKQLSYCAPNIDAALALKPTVVIVLGSTALAAVVGKYWKENPGSITRWVGWKIPLQKDNLWICPTYHPDMIGEYRDELPRMFIRKHIEAALELTERPRVDPIDYATKIDCVFDDVDAARMIRKMIERGGSVAFDYECDRLKPEHRDATIVCASVCWMGKKTIAFPWRGKVKSAMKELLACPTIGKIAANAKFEDRWSQRKLGLHVRNWIWDTMLGAHLLDFRQQVTGLKFQTFVRLGVGDYNSHIETYLKPEGMNTSANDANRIQKTSIKELLVYNGLDSLLEYEIAVDQIKEAQLDQACLLAGRPPFVSPRS